MNNEIEIREAVKSDLPVLRLHEQEVVNAERPMNPTIKESGVVYYDLEALIENPRATVLVACHDDKIVATGYALEKPARDYLDHETFAYLGFMFTDPAYRGRGLNGKIIDALIDWATNAGLTEIKLDVYSDNDSAIRAYEKKGFKRHMIEMRLRTE
ncbi:GNAT family N-acetyltransferase [Maribacter litoralis]|uniref:Acetyltransferase (GNAT) family protein n=1 Tax=Maribacter litoralis TaxID=2059726 RepID=A0A653N684_9FLAO|nr:GNAT family N-acetyltransferase [Maribacter litoralis]VXB12346.1 Acetyltransferase (GNAT) family protein [Maribacter litoralis]